MPKKRYNAEEIIRKLRGADVLLGQGKTVSQVCKQTGVSDTKRPKSSRLRALHFVVAGEGFEPPTGFYPVGDSITTRTYAVAVVNSVGSC
jgi:hypothetical protein